MYPDSVEPTNRSARSYENTAGPDPVSVEHTRFEFNPGLYNPGAAQPAGTVPSPNQKPSVRPPGNTAFVSTDASSNFEPAGCALSVMSGDGGVRSSLAMGGAEVAYWHDARMH
ncbi:unannotated protein [freshwater metagenome]|uniref:Unannotated protein n=1 Tax=freshwater metagenome TaxID=449393 RepID=A0A6J7UE89_9ZZZZ